MNEYREEEPAIVAPSNARELFDTLAAARNARIAAEARELDTIHRLCLAYHAVDEDAFGEAAEKLIYHGADGTPAVAEYLSLEVSALLGITPGSGATLIGQVLNCVYRHPLLWDAVQAGWVRWRRALDVIGEVNSAGLDAAAARWVDQRITPLLATLSPARVRRTLAGLISLADPEAARRRDDNPRRTRHATFWASGGPCRDLTARMLLSDAMALDTTLDQLAAALAAQGDEDALDIRRSTALGALADPEYALSLLQGHATPKPLGQATVVLHLSESSLADDALVGRVEGHGPLSREAWRELLGHDRVTIRPVVDLNAIPPVDAYEIPDAIRTAVCYRTPVDGFPYGTHPSKGLDLDHTEAYDHSPGHPPDQTRTDNLAPLTRKPHRAKTARHWKLTQYEGGWLEWTSPAGYHYAVGPYGTLREVSAA
jgi:hypothetical protein